MVVKYNIFDVEITYLVIFPFPYLFTYTINVQEYLRNLIPGLIYPGLLNYTVKDSMQKSVYFFESNYNPKQKLSG